MIPNHGGNIREAVEKYNILPENIIDFSANINPLGLSSRVKEAIIKNFDQILHYPDPECKTLRQEFSNCYGINYENTIAGNGCVELIYLITSVLKPRTALILVPTFSEYATALQSINTNITFWELEEEQEFKVPIAEIIKQLNKWEVIFLCNPNNPTGGLIPKTELIALLKEAEKQGVTVILDEAFIDVVDKESLIKQSCQSEYLFVVRSLTKFFGLAGLRLGFGIGHQKIINRLKSSKIPWSVNAFAQIAGIEVLKDIHFRKHSKKFILEEKNFLYKELLKIKGLKPYYPSANFILIKLESFASSTELYDRLAKKGLLIRDCSNFHGLDNKFIRIAVRTREENEILLKTLWEENI